jgi:hypothetical protein
MKETDPVSETMDKFQKTSNSECYTPRQNPLESTSEMMFGL